MFSNVVVIENKCADCDVENCTYDEVRGDEHVNLHFPTVNAVGTAL